MIKYVVANWKSHKTLSEAEKWFAAFFSLYRPNSQVRVIIAPSFVCLAPLRQILRERQAAQQVELAVQDLSPFPLGDYTGAVAAAMVKDMADFAIVGHADRRRYFHETNQEIANKVSEAAAAGIKPILCVYRPHARAQIAALNEADIKDLIISYRPIEAVGIDIPQPPEKAAVVIQEIQMIIPERPVLYGGSLDASTAANYINLEGVSGLMVGAASLDAEEFAAICGIVAKA